MPCPKSRRLAALALAIAITSMKLTACFLNPIPPSPHEAPDADPPGDPPDGGEDAGDASEDAP